MQDFFSGLQHAMVASPGEEVSLTLNSQEDNVIVGH